MKKKRKKQENMIKEARARTIWMMESVIILKRTTSTDSIRIRTGNNRSDRDVSAIRIQDVNKFQVRCWIPRMITEIYINMSIRRRAL